MFDKEQFDIEMENARQKQIEDLADYLADYIKSNARIREKSINNGIDEEAIKRIENMTIPQKGRDIKEASDELVNDILKYSMLLQHPRFFSFVASAVSPYSLAGTILTDIYNPHGGGWNIAPGACLIEEKLIKWMGSLASYPEDTCGGLFVSGGSMANLTALIAARNNRLDEYDYPKGVAYLSDQTHSSVSKGLRLIGFRRDQIVKIPTDDDFKMRVDLLEEQIKLDMSEGKKPFVVIGTIGTTNTGSIDPIPEIGEICKNYNLWFHIDGAYGGSILFSDIYRNLARGIEKSDSFSWDTHKWALQTYSCSSIIVKDKVNLLNAFAEHPEYLEDVINEDHADPWNLGQEMTRPHRSLKLWLTLQALGTDKLADIIDYSFFNAKTVEKELSSRSGWEIMSKPSCGAITFRYVPKGYTDEQVDELTSQICNAINSSGYAYIVTSTIKGKRIIRLCLVNGNTTTEDVINTIEKLDEIAHELSEKNLKRS